MPVRPELVKAIIQRESAGNPNAVSPKGAIGLMQIMPSVAHDYGVDPNTLNDPVVNRKLGTRYISDLIAKNGGDERQALIDYNQGPNKGRTLPDAANYADAVLARADQLKQGQDADPVDNTDIAYANRKANEADEAAGRALLQAHPELNSDVPGQGEQPTFEAQGKTPQEIEGERQQVEGAAPETEQPAVDPTFVIADALAGGVPTALKAGLTAGASEATQLAAQSAVYQEIQTHAAKLAGMATDNPYVKAIAGIAAPIAVSILAHRLGPTPVEGEAAGAEAGGEGAEPPSSTTEEAAPTSPETPAPAETPRQVTPETVVGPATASENATNVTPLAPQSKAARDFLEAHGEALPDVGDVAAAAAPEKEEKAIPLTPESAVNELAEKQLAALKEAKVGKGVAEEFGSPDIATEIPEEITQQEGEALRQTLEPPAPGEIQKPTLAPHMAALAQTYQADIGEQIQMARDIIGRAAKGEDVEGDLQTLSSRFSAFAPSYANIAGARSDIARGLEILSPLKPGNAITTQAAKIAQAFDTEADPMRLASELASLTPEAAIRMARQLSETKMGLNDAIHSFYANNLTSAPSTLLRIPFDTAITTLLEVPTRAIAGLINTAGFLRGPNGEGVDPREAFWLLQGAKNGFRRAIDVGKAVWQTGEYQIQGESPYAPGPSISKALQTIVGIQPAMIKNAAGKMERVPYNPISPTDWIGTALDYLGDKLQLSRTALMTSHQFSLSMAQSMETSALAGRMAAQQATDEGLSGLDAAGRAMQLRARLEADPPQEIIDGAKQFGDLVTYAKKFGPIAQTMSDAIRKIPGLNMLIPFFKVMSNMEKYGLSYLGTEAGAGAIRGTVGPQQQIALARTSVGILAGAIAAHEVARGTMTGSLSYMSPAQKQLFEQKGGQAYSFHAFGHYIAMPGPMKPFLGTLADLFERVQHLPDSATQAAYTVAALKAASKQVTSLSMMVGLKNAMDMIENPDELTHKEAGARFIGQLSAGLVPFEGLLNSANRATDPFERQTEPDPTSENDFQALTRDLMSRFPITSEMLGERYDVYGEPIMRQPGTVESMFWPVDITKDSMDAKSQALIDNHVQMTRTPRYIQGKQPEVGEDPNAVGAGIPLSDEQQDQWSQTRGKKFAEMQDRVSNWGLYKNFPNERKRLLEWADAFAVKHANIQLLFQGSHPMVHQVIQKKLAQKRELLEPEHVERNIETGGSSSGAGEEARSGGIEGP